MISAPTFDAASTEQRLISDWRNRWVSMLDPNKDWVREARLIGVRAWQTVLNDSNCTALLNTVTSEVIGTGLRFRSQYQGDNLAETSDGELQVRRLVDRAINRHSRRSRLDAGATLSRVELETQILVSGFVSGDGFAVRTYDESRPGAIGYGTGWRVIDPARVCNPDGRPNSENLFEGIELKNGQPVAIHIKSLTVPGSTERATWQRVPWYDADGYRTVIHYVPDRQRPGAIRGVSKYAPVLVMAKHLMLAFRAHVVGKGIQAMHPTVFKVNNPAAAAKAARDQSDSGDHTPMSEGAALYVGKDADVTFPQIGYQGADFRDFIDTGLRSFAAAWGYPWQFVLRQLSDANLAAAQAALDQTDKTTTIYQDGVIHQICEPLDESIVREAVARGRIVVPVNLPADFESLTEGAYARPRRADANRLRSRQAAELAIKLGVSPSTAFAELGYDYLDEQLRTQQDLDVSARRGNAASQSADNAFIERVKNAQDTLEQSGVEGVTWSAVIASSGATTAPGAYIAATGSALVAQTSSLDPIQPTPAPADSGSDQTDAGDSSDNSDQLEQVPA